MILNVVFYKTTTDRNYLTKNLSSSYKTVVTPKDDVSVSTPIFFLSYNEDLIPYNYVYVVELNRYYYIDEFILNSSATMSIRCSIDVLMTYAIYIKSINGFIERQEFKYNRYFVDTELLTRADKTQILNEVGQVGVNNVVRYYLVTTGGN